MAYRLFFLGRNFVSGLLCTLHFFKNLCFFPALHSRDRNYCCWYCCCIAAI